MQASRNAADGQQCSIRETERYVGLGIFVGRANGHFSHSEWRDQASTRSHAIESPFVDYYLLRLYRVGRGFSDTEIRHVTSCREPTDQLAESLDVSSFRETAMEES
jgi:hypothetical protein